MMNIREWSPEKVVEPSWLDEYNQKLDVIWWQLVRLNSNILILEEIFAFPFDLLQSEPPSRNFWNLVTDALFETSVMIIWRVAVDTRNEVLTLQMLKNEIRQHLKTEDYRKQFQEAIKKVQFEKTVSAYKSKIEELRDNYFAHLNRVKNTNPTPDQVKQRTFLFSELKRYRDELNLFFNLLCFGHQKALFPWDYYPDVGNSTDIKRILDNIARESALLNLPENNPAFWSIYRKNLSEHELKLLNEYRAKFELQPV